MLNGLYMQWTSSSALLERLEFNFRQLYNYDGVFMFGGQNKLMYIVHYFVSFSLVPNTEIILKLFDILRIDLAKEFNKQLLRNNTL